MVSVRRLVKEYPVTRGALLRRAVGAVQAVSGVSFDVMRGETLGVVGESGCGKTTLARCLLGLVEPTSGSIRHRLDGDDGEIVDPADPRAPVRWRLRTRAQIVFQDPYASLDPRMTVATIVAEPLRVHRIGSRADRVTRVDELLEMVGLAPEVRYRRPGELSGGQCQRVGLARALALDPGFLVLDEPVSALDASTRAQVLNLLGELRDALGLTCLFIAHDLAVVRHVSDRIAVMYLGRLAEIAPADDLCRRPLHPYTRGLLASVPDPDPRLRRERAPIAGDVPSPTDPPPGCRFHPRCPHARPGVCDVETPELRELEPGHLVACHFPGENGSTPLPDPKGPGRPFPPA